MEDTTGGLAAAGGGGGLDTGAGASQASSGAALLFTTGARPMPAAGEGAIGTDLATTGWLGPGVRLIAAMSGFPTGT